MTSSGVRFEASEHFSRSKSSVMGLFVVVAVSTQVVVGETGLNYPQPFEPGGNLTELPEFNSIKS